MYAIVGAMQIYDYAKRNFGGLFNIDAHLWLADNYCQYGGGVEWMDKVKLATGEELNPKYLMDALRSMDWRAYYMKRVKEHHES